MAKLVLVNKTTQKLKKQEDLKNNTKTIILTLSILLNIYLLYRIS